MGDQGQVRVDALGLLLAQVHGDALRRIVVAAHGRTSGGGAALTPAGVGDSFPDGPQARAPAVPERTEAWTRNTRRSSPASRAAAWPWSATAWSTASSGGGWTASAPRRRCRWCACERETVKLGGAANVAANIRALGAEVVLSASAARTRPPATCAACSPSAASTPRAWWRRPTGRPPSRPASSPTTSRWCAPTARTTAPWAPTWSPALVAGLAAGGAFDGLVLSDYGKGLLTDAALAAIIARGRELGRAGGGRSQAGRLRPVPGRHLPDAQPEGGRAGLRPGHRATEDTLRQAGRTLLERTEAEAILITRGEHGMALFERDGGEHHLPTEATTVYDVTGAGDTVIAVYTTALAAGRRLRRRGLPGQPRRRAGRARTGHRGGHRRPAAPGPARGTGRDRLGRAGPSWPATELAAWAAAVHGRRPDHRLHQRLLRPGPRAAIWRACARPRPRPTSWWWPSTATPRCARSRAPAGPSCPRPTGPP